MNPILRNIIAVVTGIVAGSAVNMFIITISGSIIPPPEGADVTTMEGLKASIHLFEPKNFILPFLAHALGTFAGALITVIIAANNQLKFALVIGIVFLAGGIMNVVMLPSPLWFTLIDLIVAYIPAAYLAWWVLSRKKTD
jgi:hypothetical protein